MANKKRGLPLKSIGNIILFALNFSNVFFHLKNAMQRDVKAVKSSFISVLILSFVMVLLIVGTWLGILGLLFLYFLSLNWGYLLSLLTIIGINVLLMIIIGFIILKAKKNLFFPETTHFIKEISNHD